MHKPDVKLVAVERAFYSTVDEMAGVLRSAGLSPSYDARRLFGVKGAGFSKVTIYVPEAEEARAREVLAAWWEASDIRIEHMTHGLWKGFFVRFAPPLAALIGVMLIVTLLTKNTPFGAFAAIIAFFVAVVWREYRRRKTK